MIGLHTIHPPLLRVQAARVCLWRSPVDYVDNIFCDHCADQKCIDFDSYEPDIMTEQIIGGMIYS